MKTYRAGVQEINEQIAIIENQMYQNDLSIENISVTLGDRPGLGYVGQSPAQYTALRLFAANIIGEVAAAARSTVLVVCHF